LNGQSRFPKLNELLRMGVYLRIIVAIAAKTEKSHVFKAIQGNVITHTPGMTNENH